MRRRFAKIQRGKMDEGGPDALHFRDFGYASKCGVQRPAESRLTMIPDGSLRLLRPAEAGLAMMVLVRKGSIYRFETRLKKVIQ